MFNIDLNHIQPLKSQFIKCDKDRSGLITIRSLVKRFNKINLQLPQNVFNFFINTLMEKQPNQYLNPASMENKFDPDHLLSFKKMQSMIQIYNRCPVSTKGYTNNSNNIRNIITMPGYKDDIGVSNTSCHHSNESEGEYEEDVGTFKNFMIQDNLNAPPKKKILS